MTASTAEENNKPTANQKTLPVLIDPSKVRTKAGDPVRKFTLIKQPVVWCGVVDSAIRKWTAEGVGHVNEDLDMDNEAWLHPGDLCLFYDDDMGSYAYRIFSYMDNSALFPFIDNRQACWSRAKKIMSRTELQKLLNPMDLEEK